MNRIKSQSSSSSTSIDVLAKNLINAKTKKLENSKLYK